MTQIIIIANDGGNILSLEPLTIEQAESLAMYIAISNSRTWQEIVMDISNWTTRFKATLARELPALLPINIQRKHNGKIPQINGTGTQNRKVSTGTGTTVTVSKPQPTQEYADDWDIIVKSRRKR